MLQRRPSHYRHDLMISVSVKPPRPSHNRRPMVQTPSRTDSLPIPRLGDAAFPQTQDSQYSRTPQGGVISPLLSNIYLHVLDTVWERRYGHLGTLVRYADDFVVMSRTAAQCEEAEGRVQDILHPLRLH